MSPISTGLGFSLCPPAGQLRAPGQGEGRARGAKHRRGISRNEGNTSRNVGVVGFEHTTRGISASTFLDWKRPEATNGPNGQTDVEKAQDPESLNPLYKQWIQTVFKP